MGFVIADPIDHDFGTSTNAYASLGASTLNIEPSSTGFTIRCTYKIWLDRQARINNKAPVAVKELLIPLAPSSNVFSVGYEAAKSQWNSTTDQM